MGVIPSSFYVLRVDAEPLTEMSVTDDLFEFVNRWPGVFRIDIIDSEG
jgi:hypothetical protein